MSRLSRTIKNHTLFKAPPVNGVPSDALLAEIVGDMIAERGSPNLVLNDAIYEEILHRSLIKGFDIIADKWLFH